jgi:hypothetical protein
MGLIGIGIETELKTPLWRGFFMDLDSCDLPAITLNPLAPDAPIGIPIRNQTGAAALMMISLLI